MKINIYLLLLLSVISNGNASDLRLRSLGNARLALYDSENELNLYHFSRNPAYLMFDEDRDWLKFYGGGNYFNTSLKRLYDPEMEQNVDFDFIGYKILGAKQAIWGKVTYGFNSQYHVSYAIEPDPHADDPVVLTDTTSGNFSTDGPAIQIRYHAQPWSRLGFGAEIEYDISTGLKEQYTRPRTIHRNFAGKLGMTYHLSPALVLGSWARASFLQDQIELNKSWDGKDIYTRRYRSELVYRGVMQEFDRYINLNGWIVNFSVQYQQGKLQNLLSADYLRQIQEVSDQTGTVRKMDSFWYQQVYQIDYRGRLGIGKMIVGWQAGYREQEDWSEHPTLPILITDRFRRGYQLGAGISLPVNFLLLVGEAGYQVIDETYHDYQSQITREGKIEGYLGIVGCEFALDPIHYLRLGYNYDYFNPGFVSPQYLPEYKGQYLSFGLAEVRSTFEVEVHFDYTLKNGEKDDHSYRGWNGLLYTRIYIP